MTIFTAGLACAQPVCTPERRAEVLRDIQKQVFEAAPRELASLDEATRPGGPLEGWRLSHGHVVLEGAGAVVLDNLNAKPPMPPALLYAPSPDSSPADWLDWDGEDGPYRLVGWAYLGPFGPAPPNIPCVAPSEWFVHEAGWHLMNGSMLLTPESPGTEPPRPPIKTGIHMWHPRVWDIHFWAGDDVPALTFDNPKARQGGLCLPEGSFYRLVDGRKEPVR